MVNITLLDGGMGQELARRSSQEMDPLWSAKILMDEPELVLEVHLEYIQAGARIITLNSYSATPERLERQNSKDWFVPLQERAIDIAKRARDSQHKDISIAGCLPPLYTSYQSSIDLSFDECLSVYQQIANIQAPHVDLFLCETMASIKEASAAATAAIETGVPCWLSLSLDDDQTCMMRSGETLKQTLQALQKIKGIDAILLNCSTPETITQAMKYVSENFNLTGAYANGFVSVSDFKLGDLVKEIKTRKNLSPDYYSQFAMGWLNDGARILGGCCEIGPDHIRHLHQRLLDAGYNVIGFQ